jgi:DNA repair protein RecO (recombination protein O)
MLKESEAIVLRNYPLRESDLLVTFFTRAEGKVRGVAKAALKSRRRFGGALEPLTLVRVYWEERERQELARIDSCDVLDSPLADAVNYSRAVALAHVAEVLDELLPDREANDPVFRLANSVLQALKPGLAWAPVTYFDLWMVRLTGLLPHLNECGVCGVSLEGEAAYFHPLMDGLMCAGDRRLASDTLAMESRRLAAEMFRRPIGSFVSSHSARQSGADLRRFLIQRMERHMEKPLVTAHMLDKLGD